MRRSRTIPRKRINITLPQATLRLLDRVAPRGDRSQFIDQAVRNYIAGRRRATLRRLLKKGAVERAERDLEMTEDWFGIENEAWHPR